MTHGVHLTRGAENTAAIDALAGLLGGRVGLGAVLGDLDRRARRGFAPGLAARQALTWDREDRRTTRWWPQGISTSADASDSERVAGRRLVAVSWYAKPVGGDGGQGVRVTFLDLDTRRYRHVLLVTTSLGPDGSVRLEPLRVHAGGLVWCGPWLHVAATGRGFLTCHVDDVLRVPDERASGDGSRLAVEGDRVSSYGYRYLLPVRFEHRAGLSGRWSSLSRPQQRLRYSCLSLDRSAAPPELVVGEYGRGDKTRRLARFALDPDNLLPAVDEDGLVAAGVARRARRARHPGRGDRAGRVVPDRLARHGRAGVGVRRAAGRLASAPLGDSDGAGGPVLLALDRHVVVGDRAPGPALGLRDERRSWPDPRWSSSSARWSSLSRPHRRTATTPEMAERRHT